MTYGAFLYRPGWGSGGGTGPSVPRKRREEIMLHIPGAFAMEQTNNALHDRAFCFFRWFGDDLELSSLNARCIARDSGDTQPQARLMVNGVAKGDVFSPTDTSWTSIDMSGIVIKKDDDIEISIVATGRNKDSCDLTVFLIGVTGK